MRQQAPGVDEGQDGDERRENDVRGMPVQHLDGEGRQDRTAWAHWAQGGVLVNVRDACMVLGGLLQHEHDDDVDDQAAGRDGEHETAVDLRSLAEPAPGLEQDPRGDHPQNQCVGEGGQNFGPLVAERAFHGRGGRLGACGKQRQAQGDGQRQPVSGVGQERQAAGQDAAGHLRDRHRDDETERGS